MVKYLIFFLSLFFSNNLFSQRKIDSIVNIESLKDSAWNIFIQCIERNNINTNIGMFSPVFINCIDTGILYYNYSEMVRLKSMPYFKKGEYLNAMKFAINATKMDPKEYEYLSYVLIYHLKDYKNALNGLKSFDSLTPNFVDIVMGDNILSLYGLCYSELGILDTSLYFYDSLLNDKKHFKSYRDYLARGIVFLKSKKYEKAIIDFNQAINEYSKCPECYYYKSLALFNLNQDSTQIEVSLKLALKYFEEGFKNNEPYGEYVDLPNQIWRSDILNLYYKIKKVYK